MSNFGPYGESCLPRANGVFAIEVGMRHATAAISSARSRHHADPVAPHPVECDFDAAARASGAMLNGDEAKATRAVYRPFAVRSGAVLDAMMAAPRFVGMELWCLHSSKATGEAALAHAMGVQIGAA